MKLSIITVNLNNRDGLKRTIDSVVHQIFNDYEWIVIDGGSTDGSKELIESYASYFSYWVSEPDKGIYNAMNKGVFHSRGEYLLFLNSGDYLADSNSLPSLFSNDINSDIVYCDFKVVHNKSVLSDYHYTYMTLFNLMDHPFCHNAVLIKRHLLVKYPYDEEFKIISDRKFFLQSALRNNSFLHIDQCLTCYDNSGISSNSELFQIEYDDMTKQLIPTLLLKDIEIIRETESYLSNTKLDDFIRLRRNHSIIGKLLTCTILLMKQIDSH